MNKLDILIKTGRPAVPDLPENFSRQVMSKITKSNSPIPAIVPLRYRVKWMHFVAGLLFLVLSLIVANSVIFEIQMNGSIELLYFGSRFIKNVIEFIPFDSIFLALTIAGFSSWLVWNSKVIKTGITTILIGSYLTTAFGGAALAATGLNEKVQTTLSTNNLDLYVISWFYKERARFFVHHPNFRMGSVVKLEKKLVWIIDPHGKRQGIVLPIEMNVQKGQVISLVGVESGGFFRASIGRHCNQKSVRRYFSHMPMMHRGVGKSRNDHQRVFHKGAMMQKGMM